MKKAFLVLGPESSGTRLMVRILIAAGCYGDDEHEQRLDIEGIPADEPLLVWRRSVPHAREWPDLLPLVRNLRKTGYTVRAVMMVRDWFCTMRSQVEAGHVTGAGEASRNLSHAYIHIFTQLAARGVEPLVVSYEALCQRPSEAMAWLAAVLEIPLPQDVEEIYDGNERWYEQPERKRTRSTAKRSK